MIDVEHYPVTVILPIFAGPTIAPFPDMIGKESLPWGRMIGWDFNILKAKYGIESFASNSIDGLSFARMLAKVAYADAVARIGLANFMPILLALILRDDVEPARFIGTFPQIDEPEGDQINYHIVCLEMTIDGVRYLLSKVRLFSNLGAPTYLVTVGVLNSNWTDPRQTT